MRDVGRDQLAWLAEGAHFTSAAMTRMAKDVELTLIDVITEHGGVRPPKRSISSLIEKRRYKLTSIRSDAGESLAFLRSQPARMSALSRLRCLALMARRCVGGWEPGCGVEGGIALG